MGVAHVQALQDGGVEGRSSATTQERVKLDQELVIRVISLDTATSVGLNVVSFQINTLERDVNIESEYWKEVFVVVVFGVLKNRKKEKG